MKNCAVIAVVACIVFVTLAAVPGHAQALLKADVPFEFCAGHGVLPAGEYSIGRLDTASQILLLASAVRKVEFMMPLTTHWRTEFETPKLVFHRYGDEYFLIEICTSADDSVRKLKVNPRERQLAKAGESPQVAAVYGVLSSAKGH